MMRKSNREITEKRELENMIRACGVCRLAFRAQSADEAPYIVPLNFGMDYSGEMPVFYFHCAREGRKLDLMRIDPRVGFEMDRLIAIRPGEEACRWSANYESVIGTGILEMTEDPEERISGLTAIMKMYGAEGEQRFDSAVLPKTAVLRLSVLTICGKRLIK
jgi:nitroimidazol reductase NimA-like FMN-containing flavoprotein (pyridoxamine 5'-phosphate oxidase superfamily)